MVDSTRARFYPPGGRRWVQAPGRDRERGMYRLDEPSRRGVRDSWASLGGVRAAGQAIGGAGAQPRTGARARRREVRRDLELDRAVRLPDAEAIERARRRAGDHRAVDAEEARVAQAGEPGLVGPVVGAPGVGAARVERDQVPGAGLHKPGGPGDR